MTNYKCVLSYDGKRYKGFRKTNQGNADQTIEGKLEAILRKRFDKEIEITSAVNTSPGVHALQQIFNFKIEEEKVAPLDLKSYFDEYLPEDIVLRSVEKVDDRFHSRYNIKSITYQYRLWKFDASQNPLFERQYVNKMDRKLNVLDMQYAASKFIGEHDFTAFSTKSKSSPMKTIFNVKVEETPDEIFIDIEANGFLLHMERIIVGTLIQIGLGQRDSQSIENAFKSKNNQDAGHKAMAHALFLTQVKY